MDPWGNAAAQYNQGLGQLQQINQQGYQAQAQGPASIYDRFLQGYVQAKQMKMQEAQMERENAYKLAQSAHLNAQTGDLFQKRQDAETAAKAQQDYDEAFKNAIDEKGNIDQAKLAGELARRGQASYLPKAMKEVLVNDETKAKTLKERAASDKAAREHIASLAGIGLQGDPSGAIRNIKGLAESNPELYGKHIGVLAMVDPQNPDAQRLALRTLYGQGIEAKELAPKSEIKEIGGKVGVYNVSNPLIGGVTAGPTLGVNASSTVGHSNQDLANNLLTPGQHSALVGFQTTHPPTIATVQLQQMGDPKYDGTTPLDPQNETIAKAMKESNFNINDNMRADPAFKRQYIRATYLANSEGKEAPGTKNTILQKATTGALQDIEKKKATYDTYNNILGKNIDGMLAAAAKLPDGGARFLNTPIRALATQASNKELAEFMPWYNAVTREYGKVSGFTNAGVLTDNAVKHAEEVLAKNGTLGEFLAATKAMHQESRNTAAGWDSTRQGLINQIRTGPQGGGSTPPSASGGGTAPSQETATRKWKQDPQTKKFGWRVFKNGKWEWE